MNTYDIASVLFFSFYFFIKSNEFKRNNFIVNTFYFILFGLLFLASCSFVIAIKYTFVELQKEDYNKKFETLKKSNLIK